VLDSNFHQGVTVKRLALSTALATSLALIGGAALADSRGAGAVTSVSYTLIDLNPNDGVAPSISFAGLSGNYAGAYA
jgi:hypothetical protein